MVPPPSARLRKRRLAGRIPTHRDEATLEGSLRPARVRNPAPLPSDSLVVEAPPAPLPDDARTMTSLRQPTPSVEAASTVRSVIAGFACPIVRVSRLARPRPGR